MAHVHDRAPLTTTGNEETRIVCVSIQTGRKAAYSLGMDGLFFKDTADSIIELYASDRVYT